MVSPAMEEHIVFKNCNFKFSPEGNPKTTGLLPDQEI